MCAYVGVWVGGMWVCVCVRVYDDDHAKGEGLVPDSTNVTCTPSERWTPGRCPEHPS